MSYIFANVLYFASGFFVALTLVADLQQRRNAPTLAIAAVCTLLGAVVIGAL
jgi:hypothetical protein